MVEIQQLKGFNSVGKNKRKKQIILTHTSRNVSDYILSLKNRYNGKYDKIPHFLIKKDGRVLQMIDYLLETVDKLNGRISVYSGHEIFHFLDFCRIGWRDF